MNTNGKTVTLLYGPPCAGKTTAAKELAQEGDLILDRDAIASAITANTDHDHDEAIKLAGDVLWRVLLDKARDHPHDVWIVSCAPTRAERLEFAPLVDAMRLIWTDQDTCLARATAERPSKWAELVRNWFEDYEPEEEDED